MLARANRLVTGADFRRVIRTGSKTVAACAVFSVVQTAPVNPVRFGFVVSKAVGNAVQRNRIRRQLRAAARELLGRGIRGCDLVVRVLPGAETTSVEQWRTELTRALSRVWSEQ